MCSLVFLCVVFLGSLAKQIPDKCEGQQCVIPAFNFDIITDGTENQKKCAWTFTDYHEQKKGACYLSSVFRAHAFRRCVANLDAGYDFDENYFKAIHAKSKECLFIEPSERQCGGFDGGFRRKVLEYLATDQDGPVEAVYGVRRMQQEIFSNGVITTGFTVPMDFPYHQSSDPYRPSYRGVGEDHAVIIYGWSTDMHGLYWLASNSWQSMQTFKIYADLRLGIEHRGLIHKVVAIKEPPQWSAALVERFDVKSFDRGYSSLALIGGDFGFGIGPAPYPYHYDYEKYAFQSQSVTTGDLGAWNGNYYDTEPKNDPTAQ